MKPLTPFFFGQLADEGLRVTLMGEFQHKQLVCASLDGVLWRRRPGETAEEMEKRVCQDVRELMGVVKKQSSIRAEHSAFVD